MDLRKVKKLIQLLEESQVSEIEVVEGEESIRISRYANSNAIQTSLFNASSQAHLSTQAPSDFSNQQQNIQLEQTNQTQTDQNDDEDFSKAQKSPMVGTFYSAPSPNSEPFVKIGDKVAKGDTLCIVEAMKMMNQIEAEKSGTVAKIFLEDGDPVEYDQPLILIE